MVYQGMLGNILSRCWELRRWKGPEGEEIADCLKLRSPPNKNPVLGCGFRDFLFSPLFGEDSHFDEHIF